MILKRDEFIQLMFPYSFTSEAMKYINKEIEKIIQSFQISLSSRVLNSFCNVGAHAIALANKGFDVVARDNLSCLDLARQQSQEKNLKIKWEKKDCTEKYEQKFNYIFNLGYSFGFFENIDQDKKVLCNLLEHLKPGGMIFLQIIGRDLLEKYFKPKFWIKHDDNSYLLNERHLDYTNGWLEEHYTYIKGSKVEEFKFGSKVYYPHEIAEILEKCGFKNVKTYGSLDKSSYEDQSECLFLCAQKEISQSNFIRC